ncbi:MAG: glycosyltransferase family 2 protein [Candidatus Cloacimonetes bacterium]|nr:glycosyltransferase family 2 protein [Candidatus Cloacimonadota bacterium]
MKLSFVIPVFNEENSLNTLYREILCNIADYDYEIIFIDDGSKDNSFQVMKTLAEKDKKVKIIKFRRNFGKSAALNIGFQNTTGEIIFTMDADLQDNPEEIPEFLKIIAPNAKQEKSDENESLSSETQQDWDIVSGWKKRRKDPLSKRLPSKLFNLVVSMTFGLKLHDYNCGFKAYKNHVLKEIDIYGEMHRYIPALASAKGFTVIEIPVNHRVRQFGKSKFGKERYIRGYLDLLTVKLVTAFNRSPLYLFGGIGTIFTTAGFILGAYLTILRIMKVIYLSNRPLLFFCMLLIIVGFQFFSIGLIGELLVNQSRKLNRNDIISVETKINI